jgi:hypothetical protein
LLAYQPARESNPFFHMLTFDERGDPIDPTGNVGCSYQPPVPAKEDDLRLCYGQYTSLARFTPLSDEAYQRYLDKVFEAREQFYRETKNPKVLIFVHGGLNTLPESIKRALTLQRKVREDKQSAYFPIFINWQSSLTSSYLDYVFNVRQGKDLSQSWHPYDVLSRWLLAPYYLAEGVVRAVVRAPLTWWNQTTTDVASWPIVGTAEEAELHELQPTLKAHFSVAHGGPCVNLDHFEERNGDCREWQEKTVSMLQWVVTSPVKLATAPFIDSFGTNAWDSMRRSTHLLFHSERDFCTGSRCEGLAKDHHIDPLHTEGIGGLAEFFRKLDRQVRQEPTKWEITVVGHSMGTIILNEAIRRFGNIPYKNIVYMAAASSIRDYEDSVLPYLRENRRHNPERDIRMYHLMLHEEAEVRDRWDTFTKIVDLPPRGSLLVWIDTFFTKPETRLDRTLGRWVNFAGALHNTGPNLNKQISVKIFDVGNSAWCTDPQKHGDFDEFPFWDPRFWSGDSAKSKTLRLDERCT